MAVLLIAAVVTGIGLLDSSDGTLAAAPTTSTEAGADPRRGARRSAAASVRPVAEVQADALEALDLAVELQAVPTADVGEGLVTAVTPTDGLVAAA